MTNAELIEVKPRVKNEIPGAKVVSEVVGGLAAMVIKRSIQKGYEVRFASELSTSELLEPKNEQMSV